MAETSRCITSAPFVIHFMLKVPQCNYINICSGMEHSNEKVVNKKLTSAWYACVSLLFKSFGNFGSHFH